MAKKGFSSLEYVVLIIVIIAALVVMSSHLRRAISGKWRTAADSFGQGRQYAPGVTK